MALNRRAAEAEARLKRIYAAIESGAADLDDPSLKERIEALKATRDQARINAERAKAAVENTGQIITATQRDTFAKAARRRIRGCDEGDRRDHPRALIPRVTDCDPCIAFKRPLTSNLGLRSHLVASP